MRLKFHHIVLFIIIMFSCESKSYEVPVDVHPYIVEFEKQGQLRGYDYVIDNIMVTYHDDMEMPHAMADVKTNRHGKIIMRINMKYWDGYKDYPMRREAIVFHEFGHYPLIRSHNGKNESLMSGNNWSITNYGDYKDEMLDELFDGGP